MKIITYNNNHVIVTAFNHKRLKNLRLETGVTQKFFANKINIPHTVLNKYENGKRFPKESLVDLWAKYYNVDKIEFYELLEVNNERN